MKLFYDFWRELTNPDNWEVNLGWLKLKYSNTEKQAVLSIVQLIQSRGVFNGDIPTELWHPAFKSLKQFNAALDEAYPKIATKSSDDVVISISLLRETTTEFLAKYYGSYIRHHNNPKDENYNPRHDWSWNLLADASHDLYMVRSVVFQIGKKLELFTLGRTDYDWSLPDIEEVFPFINSVKLNTFSNSCNVKIAITHKEFGLNSKLAIAGSWNKWIPDYDSFVTNGIYPDHEYVYLAKLTPGRYYYKIKANDLWFVDPKNSLIDVDKDGNSNSLIIANEIQGENILCNQSYSEKKKELYAENVKIKESVTNTSTRTR
jgi:hypothetical protein